MARSASPPAGPDLSQGRRAVRIRRRDAARPCRRRRGAAGALGLGDFRDRRALQPLSRPARRRPRDRREHPLSLASRLFRSAHRRSHPRAGARVRSRSGRSSSEATAFSSGEKREQPRPQVKRAGRCARQDRDRRRRRGGLCRRRDAAAAGISRQHRDAEQRGGSAGRPAEPVQGLSRRQRAGGLAAAAAG